MRAVLALVVLASSACGSTGGPIPLQAAEGAAPSSRAFSLYTHCGVESALVDGRWWHVTPPLYGAGGAGGGPPGAWDDPYQHGTLTVLSPDLAVFESGPLRVDLRPSGTGAPRRVCR